MVILYLRPRSQLAKLFKERPGFDIRQVLRKDVPPTADLVLHVGKNEPSLPCHYMTRHLGAQLVCLPGANQFLEDVIASAALADDDLVLVDAGLATTKQVLP